MNLADLVYFDLETGGLDPIHNPIIQIAAYSPKLDESFEVKLQFSEANATAEALGINSYDKEMWKKEAVPSNDAIQLFDTFLRKHSPGKRAILAAWNGAKFDGPFLHMFVGRERLRNFHADYKVYDPMQLAMWVLPELESHRLTAVAKAMKIDIEGAHDAMADVRMMFQVTQRLLDFLGM